MNQITRNKFVLIVVALSANWGCSNSSTTSPEMTIKGSVTVNGKRITGGRISFEPVNDDDSTKEPKARVAEIDKNGSYTLQTLVGKNRVVAEGKGIPDNKSTILVYPGRENFPIPLVTTPSKTR